MKELAEYRTTAVLGVVATPSHSFLFFMGIPNTVFCQKIKKNKIKKQNLFLKIFMLVFLLSISENALYSFFRGLFHYSWDIRFTKLKRESH